MVDPKQTDERTVTSTGGPDQSARMMWITPRLETSSIAEGTDALGNNPPAEGAASTS